MVTARRNVILWIWWQVSAAGNQCPNSQTSLDEDPSHLRSCARQGAEPDNSEEDAGSLSRSRSVSDLLMHSFPRYSTSFPPCEIRASPSVLLLRWFHPPLSSRESLSGKLTTAI